MKKLFLKSLALVAMLLCGLTASASAVDWSTISYAGDGAGGGTYANKYKVAFAESGLSLVNIQKTDNIQEAGFYITVPDAAFGELRIAGTKAGYATQDASFWLYISNFTAKETEVQVMTSDNKAVKWTIYVYYEDGTDVPAEPAETIKPTMTSASLASVTYNSAVINVAGTDKETENGAEVAVTRFKVVYGETSKTYTATDGQITVTGLTPDTEYTFTINAVDASDNESENSVEVKATTSADAPVVSGKCKGSQSDAQQNTTFTNPYDYSFTTSGYEDNASVLVEFTFNDVKNEVVAFLWMNHAGFAEKQMTYDATTKKASYTITELKKDDVITIAVKFAYAGGMSVTSYINYTVGTSCEEVVDNINPTMTSASLASVAYNSAVINVAGTDKKTAEGDDVSVTRFKVVYNETTEIYTATNGQITITGLSTGTTYSFTIYAVDAAGNESTDYRIVEDVTTWSYPAAAPAPVRSAAEVFSVYSDAYSSTVTRVTGRWGQQTKEQEVALAEGDKAFYYTDCNYLGWEFNDNKTIGDMSQYPNIHMDIYVPEAGSIKFTPIWGADALKEYTLVAGWNALDIDLATDFASINLANIFQLKWDAMPTVCYFDNVYFWKKGATTSFDAAETSAKVTKAIENGQLVIIRDGVRYDMMGRAICK